VNDSDKTIEGVLKIELVVLNEKEGGAPEVLGMMKRQVKIDPNTSSIILATAFLRCLENSIHQIAFCSLV